MSPRGFPFSSSTDDVRSIRTLHIPHRTRCRSVPRRSTLPDMNVFHPPAPILGSGRVGTGTAPHLPHDVWAYIAANATLDGLDGIFRLDRRAVESLCLTCRDIRTAFQPLLFSPLYLTSHTTRQLNALYDVFIRNPSLLPLVKRLFMYPRDHSSPECFRLFELFNDLHSLEICGDVLEPRLFARIYQLQSVRSLAFVNWGESVDADITAAPNLTSLRSLRLGNAWTADDGTICRSVVSFAFHPDLQELDLSSNEVALHVLQYSQTLRLPHFLALTTLRMMEPFHQLVFRLASGCPNLTTLVFHPLPDLVYVAPVPIKIDAADLTQLSKFEGSARMAICVIPGRSVESALIRRYQDSPFIINQTLPIIFPSSNKLRSLQLLGVVWTDETLVVIGNVLPHLEDITIVVRTNSYMVSLRA